MGKRVLRRPSLWKRQRRFVVERRCNFGLGARQITSLAGWQWIGAGEECWSSSRAEKMPRAPCHKCQKYEEGLEVDEVA